MTRKFWHEEAMRGINQARWWKAKLRQPGITPDEAMQYRIQVGAYTARARIVNRLSITPKHQRRD